MSLEDSEETIRKASAEAKDAAGREATDELVPQSLVEMLKALRDRGVHLEETADGGIRFASASGEFVEFNPVEGADRRFDSVELVNVHFEPAEHGGIRFDPTAPWQVTFAPAEWGGLTFQTTADGALQIEPAAGNVRLEPTNFGRWSLPSTIEGDAGGPPGTSLINENPNVPPRNPGPK